MRFHRPISLALAGMLAGCGGGGGDPYNPPSGQTCTPSATRVCMQGLTFDPASLTIDAGTSVTWQNDDIQTHTVTSNTGSGEIFNENVARDATFSFTFNTPGTYEYHCTIHGTPTTGMRGTIMVEEASAQPTPPPY